MQTGTRGTGSDTGRRALPLAWQLLHAPLSGGTPLHTIRADCSIVNSASVSGCLAVPSASEGVLWAEPREKPPPGLVDAGQNCPPGVGYRERSRSIGHRSWRGASPPGPEARRGDAASRNRLVCVRRGTPESFDSRKGSKALMLRMERRGVWLTTRAPDNPAMTSLLGCPL